MSDSLSKKFATIVRVNRAKLDMTQEQVASATGIKRVKISHIENGRFRVNLDDIKLLIRAGVITSNDVVEVLNGKNN